MSQTACSIKTPLLEQIYRTREVIDESGNSHRLHSEITQDEGQLIVEMIKSRRASRVLEIGCAYGISSLFIFEGMSEFPDPQHTIIDPGQYSEWKGIGIHNLRKAGHIFFDLIEETSELALPKLLSDGRLFQVALIDGFHTFEHVMLDFFYVQRLLEVGGVVMLDDLHLPGIRKVARYIASLPHFRIAGSAKQALFLPSWKRKAFEMPFRFLAKILPRDYSANFFDNSFIQPDLERGLISEMVAFEKTAVDTRGSHWHAPF